MDIGISIVVTFVLVLVNGYFSMSEMALVNAKHVLLQKEADEGDARAARALGLAQDSGQFLATIQVAITLVGFFASAAAATNLSDPLAKWMQGFGIDWLSAAAPVIAPVLITLVVVLNLIRSRAGHAISAIRDNEIAAKSIGINITRYKLMAFVLSSVFAGMAGVLYSLNYSSLVAKKFDYNTSINILVFVVLGGIGSIRGSVIAAAILTVLPEMLRGLNDYRMLIYAIVLIVMMIFTRSPKLVAWRKEVAEKITEKFPILKLNKFLKDKSKKEAA